MQAPFTIPTRKACHVSALFWPFFYEHISFQVNYSFSMRASRIFSSLNTARISPEFHCVIIEIGAHKVGFCEHFLSLQLICLTDCLSFPYPLFLSLFLREFRPFGPRPSVGGISQGNLEEERRGRELTPLLSPLRSSLSHPLINESARMSGETRWRPSTLTLHTI